MNRRNMRKYQKENSYWKKQFGKILRAMFTEYGIEYSIFAEEYGWSTATIRYWFSGRSLPQTVADISLFLRKNIVSNPITDEKIYRIASDSFAQQGELEVYHYIRSRCSSINEFAIEVLKICRCFAKNDFSIKDQMNKQYYSTGRIQAIVFDFDGTLTIGKHERTTWEDIWISLGYNIKACQELHLQYNRHEITHAEWCEKTGIMFRQRNLHREDVENIASKIHLIKGVRKTFLELQKRDIKIYIVSGSIFTIIKAVLKSNIQFIDGMTANRFNFDESGLFTSIIPTQYDFEGKAAYIRRIANELHISPDDILFVGNSLNDQFAYMSGAKTLCINPKLTDISNTKIWNNCIHSCGDLSEILDFIK